MHKVVTLHYTLREGADDGKLLEETVGKKPLSFIFGIGMMIPGFENNLKGKKENDSYAFLLQPAEAYGEINGDAIVEIPINNFAGPDGLVDRTAIGAGNPVRMKGQNGQPYQGTIMTVKEETVVVDFNHTMAGKKLHFSGTIESIRAATAEEIAHGHVHDGTHHH